MKLNKKQLKQVLDELYGLDGSLRERERELIDIIDRIISMKPETVIDPAFLQALREEILIQATSAGEGTGLAAGFETNYMKKFTYAFYGAMSTTLIVVIVLTAYLALNQPRGSSQGIRNAESPFEQRLSKVAAGAFGSLKSNQAATNTASRSSTFGMGGGTGVSESVAKIGAGGGSAADAKMIMPPMDAKNYRYVYKGAELKMPEGQLPVYKRIKPLPFDLGNSGLIGGLNLGFVDLSTFSGQQLQNINLIQQADYGYVTSVILDEGMVSIFQNWQAWPAARCGSDAKCYEAQRVQLSDIPPAEELVAIADAFLAEHRIDVSAYGAGEANNEWRRLYEATAVKDNYYFPDSIDVVYPSLVDGKPVYDEYNGFKTGLVVSVHIKERKVSNVQNLTTQQFESSDYELETDTKKLLAYAEKGGSSVIFYGREAPTVELELGDPEVSLTKIYVYKDGQNQELYAPALYFPIKDVPKDANFYRKAVVVPLVKEILADREPVQNPDAPVPMPIDIQTVK